MDFQENTNHNFRRKRSITCPSDVPPIPEVPRDEEDADEGVIKFFFQSSNLTFKNKTHFRKTVFQIYDLYLLYGFIYKLILLYIINKQIG